LAAAPTERRSAINGLLDQVCMLLQKHQREAGKTFVSRTRLRVPRYGEEVTVLRVVLANPLTTDEILQAILAEQCEIAQHPEIEAVLRQVAGLCTP
jgi:glutamate decarboxylase